ncbi:putative MFS family arabinose efflux permease [Paraburkholderia sp. GV068]|uniref:MFS transporter n=1 Tax=Paraburkholderia TaxID=1822464 RepID=UPI000D303C84|nr:MULTISPECIES: MFS transporter [unclassified Paraburkholderia]PTQ99138.1 putative MFS family arabinose efflux permease [Paraburkholderia sp. GV072]PUB04630.1 putative MFS family arabinose efflux permease [Paraburkholderia sp. GV068]
MSAHPRLAQPTRDAAPPASGDVRPAYVVTLFFICFAFSYLDRQVVSILVQPIKQSLVLTDTQIGLLQGLSFTMCYATAGVFVARLVDRANRVKLIAACVAIWAISTMACGFASSFPELLVARAGTAIAEAALSPAALSIFSDIYTPRRVARASSVFMLGPYVGGGVALFGGGTLLSAAHGSGSTWLAAHGVEPWQAVFVAVGLPGLALAPMVALTVREPVRLETLAHAKQARDVMPSLRDVLVELFLRNRFCLPYFAAYVALITLFYSHAAWFPTLLMRHFHLAPKMVGQLAAPAYMIGGMLGVACAGILASRVTDESALRKVLGFSAGAVATLVPTAIAMPLVSDSTTAVVLYGACAFTASIAMGLAPVPLQIAVPNRMRGRSLALLVFMTNAISGGVGPLAVGALNEHLGHGGDSLGVALALTGGLSALIGAALYAVAMRRVPVVHAAPTRVAE